MSKQRILANFKGDHTGFKKVIDVTEVVLKLPLEEIKRIEDNDVTSDQLIPESIIRDARERFSDEWGKGDKNLQFGFSVEVVDSIRAYFKVGNLSEIFKKSKNTSGYEIVIEKQLSKKSRITVNEIRRSVDVTIKKINTDMDIISIPTSVQVSNNEIAVTWLAKKVNNSIIVYDWVAESIH